jgi:hypothetical protein
VLDDRPRDGSSSVAIRARRRLAASDLHDPVMDLGLTENTVGPVPMQAVAGTALAFMGEEHSARMSAVLPVLVPSESLTARSAVLAFAEEREGERSVASLSRVTGQDVTQGSGRGSGQGVQTAPERLHR